MQDSTNVDILFHYCLVRHSGPHIDQYRAIVNPLGRRFTIKITNLAIFVIWIFSALITLPFNFALTLVESKRGPVCTDAWPSAEFERFYFVCLSVVQFVIPMTIIASCYILICSHLNSSTRLNDITSTKQRNEKVRKCHLHNIAFILCLVDVLRYFIMYFQYQFVLSN